jgi:putative heme-binding domain-containing protein
VSANDAWFMPVVQKTGPDGCLYILDWYDQYHCYQDARRDPEGLDRLKGRLYRIRYKETPRAPKFDLAKESDDQLIERLHSKNVYYRDLAQRLLVERRSPQTPAKLQKLVLDESAPRKTRMHALWSLIGLGPLDRAFHSQLLAHQDPGYRAWGVRAAGNIHDVTPEMRTKIASLSRDPSRDVQLQVAIAAGKIAGIDVIPVLLDVLANCGDDKLIPHIVWQNLHPRLEVESPQLIKLLEQGDLRKSPQMAEIMPRAIERILGRKNSDTGPVVALFNLLSQGNAPDVAAAGKCLTLIAARVQTGEIEGAQRAALERELKPILDRILAGKPDQPLYVDAALLATTFRDPAGTASVKEILASTQQPDQRRLQALDALIAAEGPAVLKPVGKLLADRSGSAEFRGRVLAALGRLETPEVAPVVLDNYGKMEPDLQPKAVELLTGRVPWAKLLLAKIAAKALSANVLNVNQVRKLLATKDKDLVAQVTATWGTIRDARNPQREEIIGEMRNLLKAHRGDADRGKAVFGKVCGQCHKIYGEGQEVGPDITSNGRSSFEQLLSNVFDPSLVIGAAYQARTVVTVDGRVLTGLVAEDSPQKIVLKVQGGKLETVPRDQVEETKQSELSMMPEGLEKQLKPEELADLFAFLCLDKPPTDPSAKRLPGSP